MLEKCSRSLKRVSTRDGSGETREEAARIWMMKVL